MLNYLCIYPQRDNANYEHCNIESNIHSNLQANILKKYETFWFINRLISCN